MKRILGWPVLVGLLLAVGCVQDPYAGFKLGEAHDVVAGSVEGIGGLKRWRSAPPIHATAVVTTYGEDGQAIVNAQQQLIKVHAGTIAASAREARGSWRALANAAGGTRFKGEGVVPPGTRQRATSALSTILHRVRGPLNFTGYGEKALGAQRVHVAGMDLVRVPVKFRASRGVAAYYFDASTHALRLVTTGGDAPGRGGTVTVYEYEKMPNGMSFPSSIEVFRIGDYVLVGDQPVLQVDFHDVREGGERL